MSQSALSASCDTFNKTHAVLTVDCTVSTYSMMRTVDHTLLHCISAVPGTTSVEGYSIVCGRPSTVNGFGLATFDFGLIILETDA